MAEAKQDLRVKKTQRLLASAMLTLLEKNMFGKITVNDICAEAMVSRSAFYSHFEDKYALLRFCIGILKEKTFEASQCMDIPTRLRHVLEKISEHSNVFRNLLLSALDTEVMEMMRHAFHADFERLLKRCDLEEKMLPGPVNLMTVYYASGITSLILYWISENMTYSIDEIADCLCALLPKELLSEQC
ncbi:TetR/AcrR family transcriptional regulator [Christensenellaceae bacterium OttesenSCG-928-L17]|nr:TetR/AcrR family transcriptional regulator [Christensenellaceae bacterium OttesenSCG-928-L17]